MRAPLRAMSHGLFVITLEFRKVKVEKIVSARRQNQHARRERYPAACPPWKAAPPPI